MREYAEQWKSVKFILLLTTTAEISVLWPLPEWHISGASEGQAVIFLEDTHLHLWPETRVVGVGPPLSAPADTRTLLTHPAFRNTPHVLYFALHAHDDPPDAQKSGLIPWGTEESCGAVVEEGGQERVHGGVLGIATVENWRVRKQLRVTA
ncbi:hypothetical protein E2C01_016497 [Portunus trituberculatus]|uniref:Uncharacterized protein n=1 Tax=Portunus trituberculatus TaxID=210409 RepID=A0A5B7DQN9_PORTR|nr:hypothetical protein [Portunus trituberculatus]